MALDLVDYEQKAREAVKAFWGNREAARQKQIEAGKADQGERARVLGIGARHHQGQRASSCRDTSEQGDAGPARLLPSDEVVGSLGDLQG